MDGLISKNYSNASAFGQLVILVDTSKWTDHLRIGNECLRSLLQGYPYGSVRESGGGSLTDARVARAY
jgi:hypothetical protein